MHGLYATIQRYKLFPADTTVILAVSGGADSLALLHFCAENHSKFDCTFHVATVDHGLRPDAAADVAFVQQRARDLGLACTTGTVDVNTRMRDTGDGVEAAARRARYEFLARVASEQGTDRVATAHHADDQAETVLMHLIRGAGTRGITGMDFQASLPYHSDFILVRPMLNLRRDEIDAYCERHDLVPRVDATNADTRFFRNATRHEILPYLRQYNPQIDEALIRLADIATEQQAYIDAQFKEHVQPYIRYDGARVMISRSRFTSWHRALKRRALLAAAAHMGCDVQYHHIEQTIALAKKTVGAVTPWVGQVQARLAYVDLIIEPESLAKPEHGYWLLPDAEVEYHVAPSGTLTIETWQLTMSPTQKPDSVARLALPESAVLHIRSRRPGDRIQLLGMQGHSRKVKDLFIDQKIPQHLRDRIPLIVIDQTLAAVILPDTWRIAETFAEDEKSSRIIYFYVSKML